MINVIYDFYHCFLLANDRVLQMHPQQKQLLLFLNAHLVCCSAFLRESSFSLCESEDIPVWNFLLQCKLSMVELAGASKWKKIVGYFKTILSN